MTHASFLSARAVLLRASTAVPREQSQANT